MFHTCRIKFGSITNLTDARYAAAAYADWVGFCFILEHPRYIDPMKAKEIIDWLSGPTMVAELGERMPEEMTSALEVLMIDTVQVTSEEAATAWENAGFQVIREGISVDKAEHLRLCLPDYSVFPDQEIIDLSNLTLEEIKTKWAKNPPHAIQLIGGDESAPGIRDFAQIDEILELFEL